MKDKILEINFFIQTWLIIVQGDIKFNGYSKFFNELIQTDLQTHLLNYEK